MREPTSIPASDAVHRTYADADGNAFLAAVANWNASEPCFARLQIPGMTGAWMILDDEHRRAFGYDGATAVDAARLAQGMILETPALDYRGYRVVRHDPAALAGYEVISLNEIERAYAAYSAAGGPDEAVGEGAVQFGHDDIDDDNRFEYRISTPSQTVWISQTGHIIRWESGEEALEADGFGLCRDQFWLPLGERGNTALDGVMALEGRRALDDRAEITLSRSVSLNSVGAMVDVRLTRRFIIYADRPDIDVRVELHNTSLSMDVKNIEVSYRVHNHMRYDGDAAVWVDDGTEQVLVHLKQKTACMPLRR